MVRNKVAGLRKMFLLLGFRAGAVGDRGSRGFMYICVHTD